MDGIPSLSLAFIIDAFSGDIFKSPSKDDQRNNAAEFTKIFALHTAYMGEYLHFRYLKMLGEKVFGFAIQPEGLLSKPRRWGKTAVSVGGFAKISCLNGFRGFKNQEQKGPQTTSKLSKPIDWYWWYWFWMNAETNCCHEDDKKCNHTPMTDPWDWYIYLHERLIMMVMVKCIR